MIFCSHGWGDRCLLGKGGSILCRLGSVHGLWHKSGNNASAARHLGALDPGRLEGVTVGYAFVRANGPTGGSPRHVFTEQMDDL